LTDFAPDRAYCSVGNLKYHQITILNPILTSFGVEGVKEMIPESVAKEREENWGSGRANHLILH
jgi:hypothetical protein